MTGAGLREMFAPRGAMVIGASTTPGKLGAVMAESLDRGGLAVGRVNPRAEGPGFVPSAEAAADHIRSLGGEPDLAVLCVPAGATAPALADSAAAGARAALVCSGGFGEIGAEGARIEAEVRAEIARTGIRLVGPNSSGFFSPPRDLVASFVPGARDLLPGRVGVIAASGGVNHMLAFQLAARGVGLSLGVGIGTGIDVGHADVVRYLADDVSTDVIALHIETVHDGRALVSAVREASRAKPVVALVVGRTDVSEFATSHTGALATSWRTTRSALAQAGAVVVDDADHLLDATVGLLAGRLAPSADAGAALVTGQAGPGLLIADALGVAGVSMPRLAEGTQTRIGEHLPPMTFQANPVDTGRPGPGFPDVVAAVADDPAVDVVGIYGLTEPVVDMTASIRSARELAGSAVPIVLGMDGAPEEIEDIRSAATGAGIPFVTGPGALARALAALVEDAHLRVRPDDDVPADGRQVTRAEGWDEDATKSLLDSGGIPGPRRRTIDLDDAGRAEASRALAELGGEVVAKILDADVLHKTDIGGVYVGLRDEESLRAALGGLDAIGARRVLVEEMAPGGVDLIVGARRDPVFGPVVLLGLGGVAAEAVGDVAIRLSPLSAGEATAMADELAASALLDGWRGGPVADRDALGAIIATLGGLLAANPWIDELEINPLRVTREGMVALDAVLVTGRNDDGTDTDH
jgi:acetyltransferase